MIYNGTIIRLFSKIFSDLKHQNNLNFGNNIMDYLMNYGNLVGKICVKIYYV